MGKMESSKRNIAKAPPGSRRLDRGAKGTLLRGDLWLQEVTAWLRSKPREEDGAS